MGKKLFSFILAMGMLVLMVGVVSATEITENTEDHLIEVTGKFEEAAGDTGTYIGYNINGFDAYTYTFEEGDVLEYEVYLETATPGTGHVEIQGSKLNHMDADGTEYHDWQYLRMVVSRDAEGVNYAPSADLTSVAYKQWYKRSVPIPKAFVGFTSRHFYLMVECYEIPEENEFHFYIKNVRIVGADGEVKVDVCSNESEFVVGQMVEVSPAGTLSMELNPVYPVPDETEPETTEAAAQATENDDTQVTQPDTVQQDNTPVAENGQKVNVGLIVAIVCVVAVIGAAAFVVVRKKSKK